MQKNHDGIAVVRALSLEVAAGEVLTLLGPADAGKSVVLTLLAGLARPDGGEILLDGRAVARTPPHRRGIGMKLQRDRLLPHLTVAENVGLPLRLGRPVRNAPLARVLGLLHLSALSAQHPDQLSPDQLQRAMLARALAGAPRLVLLDEPLAGLAGPAREALLWQLRRVLRELEVTAICATRDPAVALALSDRVALLLQGGMLQLDPPRALCDSPATAAAARLLGDGNRLDGQVESVEDDIAQVRLACGLTTEAQLADAAVGRRCVLWVRPELVAVAAVSAEEMGEAALPATLLDCTQAGDHIRLHLRLGLDPAGAPPVELTVRRPLGTPLRGLTPGETVAVAWQPHHARAFQPELGQPELGQPERGQPEPGM